MQKNLKAEIKALAAEQVEERNARRAKKRETPPEGKDQRNLPASAYTDYWCGYIRPGLEPNLDRAEWQRAFRERHPALDYQLWFQASDGQRSGRAFRIRIRHLLLAYKAGVPYARVERTSRTSRDELARWMYAALLSLEPGVDRAHSLCAWFEITPRQLYAPWQGAEGLGFPPIRKTA